MWFARPRIVCLLGLRCVRENSPILPFNQYQSVSHRPKSRLSESEFELRDQRYEIRDNNRHVPETSQAVRCHILRLT